MKICFYGVGGVGGYFGSLITEKFNKTHDIYFIARGSHKETIIKQGLTVKKYGGKETINVIPKLCTDSIEEIPICDIIIVSVKSYDLENVCKNINKITDNNTIIVPLLNGVDIYDRIRAKLSSPKILPSCVYVGTHIESPGVIYQKGGNCKITLGKDPQFPDFIPYQLLEIFKESTVKFDWRENVQAAIWSKYMFIASFGLVTSAYNKTLGEILENPNLSSLTQSIMNEIYTISKGLNIELSKSIVNTSFEKAKDFPFETKTSFQRDIEHKGLTNEKDLFGDTLINYSKSLKIHSPNIEKVYTALNLRLEKIKALV